MRTRRLSIGAPCANGVKIVRSCCMQEAINKTTNESRLIYDIMQELGKHGAVFRMNSGSVKMDNGKRFRGQQAGCSDIMLIRRDGVVCFIEVKVKPAKPTDKQLAFIDKMRAHNCLAGVAYSVEEALAICDLGSQDLEFYL